MEESYQNPEIKTLMENTNNQKCIDCEGENPKWASINNSVFICTKCAGEHRSLGAKYSRVKSIVMEKLYLNLN